MNSLEFIENIIKNLKEILKGIDKRIQDDQNYPTLLAHDIGEKENFEKDLAHLQQIKSELEAWKVAKNVLNTFDMKLIEGILIGLCISSEINEREEQNFKKALEVKDNVVCR